MTPLHGWRGEGFSYLDDGMADPIYFVHALVACTLLVLGLLLVMDGINEGRDADH